jgi:hypothetical protein
MYFIIMVGKTELIVLSFVLMFICCTMSSGAYVMMGGSEEKTITTTTPAPVVEKYRYVRIIRDKDGDDHWMNLAEVEVFSGGTNVASGKIVTQ